jgi:hypothetical protein
MRTRTIYTDFPTKKGPKVAGNNFKITLNVPSFYGILLKYETFSNFKYFEGLHLLSPRSGFSCVPYVDPDSDQGRAI